MRNAVTGETPIGERDGTQAETVHGDARTTFVFGGRDVDVRAVAFRTAARRLVRTRRPWSAVPFQRRSAEVDTGTVPLLIAR